MAGNALVFGTDATAHSLANQNADTCNTCKK